MPNKTEVQKKSPSAAEAGRPSADIREVVCAELQDICNRRGETAPVFLPETWIRHLHDQRLFGISISGGGIRSATFALGALQGLAEKNLLSRADYVSTVSGGGYIGSWLQGILSRGFRSYDVLRRRIPESSDRDPITFLRKYSNYLAPRHGLSIDTLVIPLIWFRNTVLNQAIIISAFAALFLIPLWPGAWLQQTASGQSSMYPLIGLAIAFLSGLFAVLTISFNLRRTALREFNSSTPPAFPKGEATGIIAIRVVLPLFLAALAMAYTVTPQLPSINPLWMLLLGWLILFILLAALQGLGGFVRCYTERRLDKNHRRVWLAARLHVLWMSAVCASLILILFIWITDMAEDWDPATPRGSQLTLTWIPSLYLVAAIAGIILLIGLMGQDFPDSSREWLARVGALILTVCTAWSVLFAIAVLAPQGIVALWLKEKGLFLSSASGWLMSTAAAVLAGKSGKSGGGEIGSQNQTNTIDLIARYGPFVAVPGFLIAVATSVQLLLHAQLTTAHGSFLAAFDKSYWDTFARASVWQPLPWLLFASLVIAFVLLSLRVNINEFSMHHFYKNRLVRCYLGASATQVRQPDSFTGFDPQDDLPLASLICSEPIKKDEPRIPYPIINASLTVTVGSDLATQERKALSWIFTPRFSGFFPAASYTDTRVAQPVPEARTYVPTSQIAGGVRLGTATAISGAAVNPNMGFHSAPQTAFLLTLFNVRLGWWLGNPTHATTYRRSGPRFALWWLGRELLGFVDERSPYLNLSDGGHFENLGLYELVRRRCRYIIAIDGEEDTDYRFASLGGVIRKCRADFGIEIEINPRPIEPQNQLNGTHCVVGRVRYPEVSTEAGWLLYLKSSLTGDEPEDVEEYRRDHSEFPQQSTLEQFFSESQFESYRRLGLHVARTTLDHFDENLPLEKVFERLSARWEEPPKAPPDATAKHAEEYTSLLHLLMNSTDLENLDHQVIENFPSDGGAISQSRRRTFFFYLDLLQLIENVFSDLNFSSAHTWNHPANAGWKRIFEYWARQTGLRHVWEAQKYSYSKPFQDFFDDLVKQRTGVPEAELT